MNRIDMLIAQLALLALVIGGPATILFMLYGETLRKRGKYSSG